MKKIYLALLSALLTVGGGASAQTTTNYPDPETIIENQPEGTLYGDGFQSGTKVSYSYYRGSSSYSYKNGLGQYVIADDGTIYLRNVVSVYNPGTWIKLDKVSDTRYVAKFPQVLYINSKGGVDYVTRLVLKANSTRSNITYVPDSVNTTDGQNEYFTLVDGVLSMEDNNIDYETYYPTAIVAVIDENGNWKKYGENGLTISPNNAEKATLPAGVQPEYFTLTTNYCDTYDGPSDHKDVIKAAVVGNDFYLNNPNTKDSTSWIKGAIDGDKVTFKTQYVGVDYANGYHTWFQPGTYTTTIDDYLVQYGYDPTYARSYRTNVNGELTFDYDATAKTLKGHGGETLAIVDAPDASYTHRFTFDSLQLAPFIDEAKVPADPKLQNFQEYDGSYGFISFQVPDTAVDGSFLNSDKLYYNMYVNDPKTPFVFDQEDYRYIPTATMTDVPYSYNDGTDIVRTSQGSTLIYLFFDTSSIDSIGIQSIYRGGDKENRSNIVWQHTAHYAAGINGITNNDADVKGVAYYDLSGRRVAAPKQTGIYIKETTLADGTKKSVKVLKK